MPPQPVAFDCVADILRAMRSPEVQGDIDTFISTQHASSKELVKRSVTGNTFRAFHLKAFGLKPSDCYRAWTTQWIEGIVSILQAHDERISNQSLRSHLIKGAYALDLHWKQITGGRAAMGFGRAAKLLGLSVKYLLKHKDLSIQKRQELARALDVPLDSYTLQGLCRAMPLLQIPRNATMKFVHTEQQYNDIQDAIRDMCTHEITPLHYETATWRLSHPHIL